MNWLEVSTSTQRPKTEELNRVNIKTPKISAQLNVNEIYIAKYKNRSKRKPKSIDDYIDSGRAVQRFWLTASRLGLQLQPEITPLIFSRYVRNGLEFTQVKKLAQFAKILSNQTERLIGSEETSRAIFMGRIGMGPAPWSRSLRLPLSQLKPSSDNSGAADKYPTSA